MPQNNAVMTAPRAATAYAFGIPKQEAEPYKLYIYDTITKYGKFNWETWSYEDSDTSAKKIREFLNTIPDGSQLDIHINSNGGEAYEAVTIYNMLCQKNCKKTAYVDGVAHSAAFLLLFACDYRIGGKGTAYLFHNMWMTVSGNAKQLRDAADRLDSMMESNRQIYLERSKNLTEEQIIEMMEAETILTPEQCLEYGFLDEVRGYADNASEQMQATKERMEQIAQIEQLNKDFSKQMQQLSEKKPVAMSQQKPMEDQQMQEEIHEKKELNKTQQKALRMMGAFLNANI